MLKSIQENKLVPKASSSQKSQADARERSQTVSVSSGSLSDGNSSHLSDFVLSNDHESFKSGHQSSSSYSTALTSSQSFSSDSNKLSSSQFERSSPNWSQVTNESCSLGENESDDEGTIKYKYFA